MSELSELPESRPISERVFSKHYWPVDLMRPRSAKASQSETYAQVPYKAISHAARLAMIGGAPQIVAGELYGAETAIGDVVDVQLLEPGTIVLYDIEELTPGPLALRDTYVQRNENELHLHPGKFEALLNKSPRELIRKRLSVESFSKTRKLHAGGIYTSTMAEENRLYYWRLAWMDIVVPGKSGSGFAHYLNIPILSESELVTLKKSPKMLAITPSLPDTFHVGVAYKQHYYSEAHFGDFRDGVKRISSAEIIDPKFFKDALESYRARQVGFSALKSMLLSK